MLVNRVQNDHRSSPSIRRGGKRISTGQGNAKLYRLGFRTVGLTADPAQFAQRLLQHACTTVEDDRKSVYLSKLESQVVALELTVCPNAAAANLTREGVIVACSPSGLKELHGQSQDFRMLHKTTMLAVINDEEMGSEELLKLSTASAKFLNCGMMILSESSSQVFAQLVEETLLLVEWESKFKGEKTKEGVLATLEEYRSSLQLRKESEITNMNSDIISIPVLKAGYLTKQGGGKGKFSRKNWLRRWFVLQPPELSYYKDEFSTTVPLGTINLSLIAEVTTKVVDSEAHISIVTCLRTYYIKCADIQEGRGWGNLIRAAVAAVGGTSHTKNRVVASSLDNLASKSSAVNVLKRASKVTAKDLECKERRERPKYKQLLEHARVMSRLPVPNEYQDAIITGDMNVRVPKLKSKVQVFVGSGGCGVDSDRKMILQDIQAYIQELCRNIGFSFELVDPSWNALQTTDHKMLEQCLRLAKEARRTSVSTSFIAFLANSYGFRPLPPSMGVPEFEALLDRLGGTRSSKDKEIMKQWYKLDSNAVPPTMILQTIPYGQDSKIGKKEQVKILRNYADQSSRLREALLLGVHGTAKLKKGRTKADILAEATQMTSASKDHFLPSIIETEVKAAVLANKSSNRQCIIIDHKPTKGASKNRDGARLEVLKEKLNSVLPANRIIQGKDLSLVEIADSVCDVLAADIMEARGKFVNDPLTTEIRIHRDDAVKQIETIGFARSRLLKAISKYTTSTDSTAEFPPLLLHGPSGTGKSWLMAHASTQDIPDSKPVRIFRKIGLTRQSLSPQRLLFSLCSQILMAFGEERVPSGSFFELCRTFQYCLTLGTREQPLIIILDGLEKLEAPSNMKHDFSWLHLDRILPPHCRLVISCSSSNPIILEHVKVCTDSCGTLDVDSTLLGTDNIATPTLILLMNQRYHRTLSQPIANIVIRALRKSPCVQTLEILLAIASFWMDAEPTPEMENIVEVAEQAPVEIASHFLSIVEDRNGTNFCKAVLTVLSTAKEGLSDQEIIEILGAQARSLGDMNTISKKKGKMDTFPAVCWYRLKSDISSMLASRDYDGVSLSSVKYSCFRQAIEERYLKDEESRKTAHALLAKYFCGLTTTKSDKETSTQPLRFRSGIPNARRIIEMPYHLTKSGQQMETFRTLTEFEFIHAACDGQLMTELSTAMQLAMSDFGTDGYGNIAPFLSRVADQLNGHKAVFFPQIAIMAPHQSLLARQAIDFLETNGKSQQKFSFKFLRKPLFPLRGQHIMDHADKITVLQFGGGTDHLITCAQDGTAKIHTINSDDINTEEPVGEGAGYITHAAVCQASTVLLCSNKGEVSAWKSNGKPSCIASTNAKEGIITASLSKCGSYAGFVTVNGAFHLWLPKKGTEDASTVLAESGATYCQFNSAVTIASCHTDGTIKFWNAENGSEQCSFQAHTGAVTAIDFMLRDSQFVSIGKDKTIRVWDAVQCEELATLGDETREHISLKSNGSNIVCADNCGTIRIWSSKLVTTSKRKKRIHPVCTVLRPFDALSEDEAELKKKLDFRLSKDGKAIAALTTNGVGIWTTATGRLNAVLPGDWTEFTFSADDPSIFATGSETGQLKVWNISNVLMSDLPPSIHPSEVTAMALSANGEFSASGDSRGMMYIWHGSETQVKKTIIPHVKSLNSISFDDTMTKILTGSDDGTMVMLDLKSGLKERVLEGHTGPVNDAKFRVDNQMVLSASDDWTVGVWNLEDSRRVRVIKGHGGPVTCCAFSPVCGVVGFSGSKDGTVRKIDLINSEMQGTANLGSPITCLDVSTYASTILVGAENGSAYVLDGATMTTIFTLRGHTDGITGCNFSRLASFPCIITTSMDGTIKLWDDGNGEIVRTMQSRAHPITSLATAAVDDHLNIIVGDKYGYTDHLLQWKNLYEG